MSTFSNRLAISVNDRARMLTLKYLHFPPATGQFANYWRYWPGKMGICVIARMFSSIII